MDPILAQAVVAAGLAAGLAAIGLAAHQASLAPRRVPVRVKAKASRRPRQE